MVAVGGAAVDQTSVLKHQRPGGNVDMAGVTTGSSTELAPKCVRVYSARVRTPCSNCSSTPRREERSPVIRTLLAFVMLTFPPWPEVKVEALIRAPANNSNRGVATVILPAFPKLPAPPRGSCRGRLGERRRHCWIVYKACLFRRPDNDVACVNITKRLRGDQSTV